MKKNVHFFSWDDKWDVAHPGDWNETITFCTEHFINCAKEAIKLHEFFNVALSGGSTPKAIFQKLSSTSFSSEIDWTKVLIFWSDERSVAPTNQESNFRMAMDAGLKTLSIPPEHIFRMVAEDKIEENAKAYEEKIREVLGSRPFDLIMLGMGDDGHTASLFPGTEGVSETKRWVVANHVSQKKTWRMTLTLPCINRAKNTVIYVLGENKKEMVRQVFLEKPEPPFPVSLVGTLDNKALWVLDSAAGADIFNKK